MTKDYVRKYVGRCVHCHSIYGMHEGIVHRALHDGMILIHHTQLAGGLPMRDGDFGFGVHPVDADRDIRPVQFFLPAPGLFVPYGGLYGLWPRPPIII